MSEPSIKNFIDGLIKSVRDIPGIVFVPDDPPATIATHPAGVVWLTAGRAEPTPYGMVTHWHNVRIGLITAFGNMAIANQRILPQIEPVIDAAFSYMRDGEYETSAQNIEQITYTYGPIQWGDIWYFGALIDLAEVKIQRVWL